MSPKKGTDLHPVFFSSIVPNYLSEIIPRKITRIGKSKETGISFGKAIPEALEGVNNIVDTASILLYYNDTM